MIYVKVSDDKYVPVDSGRIVDVVVSGPEWDLRFGGDVLDSYTSQQDARDAALALVHKLGALVTL